jgi:hypothetical protein
MRKTLWATYLWPGLPQLWLYGSWWGLAAAILMAGVCDVLLLATFGWSELGRPRLRILTWAAFGAVWAAGVCWSMWHCRRQARVVSLDACQDPFVEAVDRYLKGDYYETEQILERLLRHNVRDLDARLMLATLWRRGGRIDEAADQLDVLVRTEGADKWELEIQQERELLLRAREAARAAVLADKARLGATAGSPSGA